MAREIRAGKVRLSWHACGQWHRSIGYKADATGTRRVPCSWYFGSDDATALTQAAAKMAEWKEAKANWPLLAARAHKAHPGMPLDMPFWIDEDKAAERAADVVAIRQIIPNAGTIAAGIEDYEAEMMRRLTLIGQRALKPGTVRAMLTDLREGIRPIGTNKLLTGITTQDLRGLVESHYGGGVSERTAVNYCRAVWRFFQWCADRYQFPLPPGSRDVFKLRSIKTTPKPPSIIDLKRFYAESPPRLRTWVLLALNCGMYESDIAALQWANIADGQVVWRRQKTSHQNDFDLYHDLWPETIAGIKAHGERDGDLLFRHTDGGVLLEHTAKTHRHIISNHVDTVAKRLKMRFPFKGIRKFGATWFLKQPDGVNLARQYLGHQPPGMLSAYVRDDYAKMNKTLARFRQYLMREGVFADGSSGRR